MGLPGAPLEGASRDSRHWPPRWNRIWSPGWKVEPLTLATVSQGGLGESPSLGADVVRGRVCRSRAKQTHREDERESWKRGTAKSRKLRHRGNADLSLQERECVRSRWGFRGVEARQFSGKRMVGRGGDAPRSPGTQLRAVKDNGSIFGCRLWTARRRQQALSPAWE